MGLTTKQPAGTVTVRILEGVAVSGTIAEAGQVLQVSRSDANVLVALGRAEIVDPEQAATGGGGGVDEQAATIATGPRRRGRPAVG